MNPLIRHHRPRDRGLTTAIGARLHHHAHGVDIMSPDTMQSFVGHFAVSRASFGRLRVGVGLVNEDGETLPTIDGVPLDGMLRGQQQAVPTLLAEGPGERLRSYVILECRTDDRGEPLAEDPYVIVHSKSPVPKQSGLRVDDGTFTGRIELAVLFWADESNIRLIVQNVYSSLRHVFAPGAKGAKGVHFFFNPGNVQPS